MKRLCKKVEKDSGSKNSGMTRKGVASLYIVIFATILFGVVTLSFMRIILSEAEQGSDDDLSRSAYDAAIAGVEDAKTAVNRYYQCLSNGGGSQCDEDTINNTLFKQDCDEGKIGLASYLYTGYGGGEVLIQQNMIGYDANNESDQAYTCVIISDTVPDYRGTLTSDTRTKVIPIGVWNGVTSSGLKDITKVRFSWYSQVNNGTNTGDAQIKTREGEITLPKSGDKTVPPTVSLGFIKVSPGYNINNFYKANTGANYANLLLLPTGTNNGEPSAGPIDLMAAGNVDNTSNAPHAPVPVTCSTTAPFMCSVTLNIEGMMENNDSAFLLASLPYGDTITDFSVTLYDSAGNVKPLTGVQISVDSTGRTDDLVRRVEVRLDPADLYFPYPQYALDLDGSGDEANIKKNFWVTANCWYSQPSQNSGQAQVCDNYGELGTP